VRCRACDAALTDTMARAVMPVSGEHWDLCNKCLTIVKNVNNPLYEPDAEVSYVIDVEDNSYP
jgi:hypothetical protein